MIARRGLLLATGALLAPSGVSAQPGGKAYRIGLLGFDLRKDSVVQPIWDAAVEDMVHRGYVEGRNLTYVPYGDARDEKEAFHGAFDLASQKVDLIVVAGDDFIVRGAMRATTVPLLSFGTWDPVRSGLVASLARPSGNLTGVSTFGPEIVLKRVRLICEAFGKPQRIAYLCRSYPTNLTVATAVAAQRAQLCIAQAGSLDQLDEAFEAMARYRPDVLVVEQSATYFLHLDRIAVLATRHRLPAIGDGRPFAKEGLLMGYGPDFVDLAHKIARQADRILKGAKPGDLPFERATKFELVINLKTAETLGLTIPPSVLLQATEVLT